MSKRPHTELIDSIAIKQVGGEDGSICGIYHGEKRLPSGKPSFDVTALNSLKIDGMQNWSAGIDKELMEFLCKLVEQEKAAAQEEKRKYRMEFFLAYAWTDEQQATFAKNLATLLSVPGLTDCIGAFIYSEGGHLADFLKRFPQLTANKSNLPRRFDVDAYCENETLVEDYFADVKHWLIDLNTNASGTTDHKAMRKCRVKFFSDRQDTAEEMLKLFKQEFEKASKPEKDRRTFIVRMDVPYCFDKGSVLTDFQLKNEKTGEVMALQFKREQTLNAEEHGDDDSALADDDDTGDVSGGKGRGDDEASKAKRSARSSAGNGAKNGAEGSGDGNKNQGEEESEDEVMLWKTYQLVRCPVDELDQLMKEHVPLLKRSLTIIH